MLKGPASVLYDESSNPVGVIIDGAIYRLQTTSKVENVAGTQINPATKETLDSIKDTDGIKKITDQLPAGTNNIGDIDVVSSVLSDGAATEETLDYIRDNVGEAVATPTAYTLLDRLKSIATSVASINLTDGVKKIVDALPIGDNWIGRTKIGDGTNTAAVVEIDGVKYLAAGKTNTIDTNNSSVTQLDPGGANAFTGAATNVSQFSSVAITIHSDEDSIVDGMKFEFSQDGTNWDDVYNFNLDASESETRRFQFPVTARYFRVNYTNGTTITTEFRVQTILHRENILTSIHRVQDNVRDDRSAQLMKSVIIAQREGATLQDFYPIKSDVAGNLKVTTVGSDIPSDPTAFILKFLVNGSSNDMLLDGSVTPVSFEIGPTVTNETWSIRELLLIFTADDFSFDGLSFGPNVMMTNGIKLEVIKDSTATEIFRVKQNEDFLRVPGRTPLVNNTGPKDVLGAALSFQGLALNEAGNDVVRITIQDNLTSVKLKYLTATLFAVKVT